MGVVLPATVIGGDDHDSSRLPVAIFAAAVAAVALIAVRRRWSVPDPFGYERNCRPLDEKGAVMTIRVLLADDQKLIVAGFRVLVDSAPDLEVVGEASTGGEAVRMAHTSRADVVLMDIRMPDMDGIEATRLITGDENLAGVKVLILTTFEIDENILHALRAGASGFLSKGVEPADLLDGIRQVARGESLLSPRAMQTLITRFLKEPPPAPSRLPDSIGVLTPREREIVALVAAGLSNDQIAEQLYVSPLTVKTHINNAMSKLGARDRAQLVVTAYQSGLVRPGDPTPQP